LSQIYWKWANFIILAGVLGYFIYKKAGAFFLSRTAAIRQGIEEADRLRRAAEERAAEIERRMNNLQAEIDSLRNTAREEMAAENERLRRETEESLQKIRKQAEQEIASAAKAARHEVRAHAAELALGLAAGKIRDRLSPAADDLLITSFLDELDHATVGKPEKEIN
jgi:F-type H+-transporting ATPase subunit b